LLLQRKKGLPPREVQQSKSTTEAVEIVVSLAKEQNAYYVDVLLK